MLFACSAYALFVLVHDRYPEVELLVLRNLGRVAPLAKDKAQMYNQATKKTAKKVRDH